MRPTQGRAPRGARGFKRKKVDSIISEYIPKEVLDLVALLAKKGRSTGVVTVLPNTQSPAGLRNLIDKEGLPSWIVAGEANSAAYDVTVERQLWDHLDRGDGPLQIVTGPIISVPGDAPGLRWCQSILGSLVKNPMVELYVSPRRQPFHFRTFGSRLAYCEYPHRMLQENRQGWVNKDSDSLQKLSRYISVQVETGLLKKVTSFWTDYIFLTRQEIAQLDKHHGYSANGLEKEDILRELKKLGILNDYHRTIEYDFWSSGAWVRPPTRPTPNAQARFAAAVDVYAKRHGRKDMSGITAFYDTNSYLLHG